MATKNAAEDRYRALLDVSSSIASQPNLQEVLRSLRLLLSAVVSFDAISILLLDSSKETVQLIAFDRAPESPEIEIGMEVALGHTSVALAIREQRSVYIPDAALELANIPELASRISLGSVHSAYVFPISTARKKLGALIFGSSGSNEFAPDVIELMTSVSSHVAVALEGALATDAAGLYQHQLAEERDRFRLLLDINNFVTSGPPCRFLSADFPYRRRRCPKWRPLESS